MSNFEDEYKGGIPENLAKKILTMGLGAYFLTEDTVRRYVKEAKIPRDLARGMLQNASKGKDELYGFVARELSGFLRQMDLQEELDRFVRRHKVRISAEVEFIPREGAPAVEGDLEDEEDLAPDRPEVEWDVKLKGFSSPSDAVEPPPPPLDDDRL